MRNPYKRSDVYTCRHPGHARFGNRVSAHHVLRVKKCHPHGCLVFKWSCELKNKGKSCVRGFKHIGRLCYGCTHYHDEKIHYQPEVSISAVDYQAFMEEVEQFEDWLTGVEGRELSFWAQVSSVKPRFRVEKTSKGKQIRLEGYLAVLKRGYIGTVEFDDLFYAALSPRQQGRIELAADDRFEARAKVQLDSGRVVMTRVHAIEHEFRSGRHIWNNSEALIARATASHFPDQPEICQHCSQGALVDVFERKEGRTVRSRALYCLAGVADPGLCYVRALGGV